MTEIEIVKEIEMQIVRITTDIQAPAHVRRNREIRIEMTETAMENVEDAQSHVHETAESIADEAMSGQSAIDPKSTNIGAMTETEIATENIIVIEIESAKGGIDNS